MKSKGTEKSKSKNPKENSDFTSDNNLGWLDPHPSRRSPQETTRGTARYAGRYAHPITAHHAYVFSTAWGGLAVWRFYKNKTKKNWWLRMRLV